MGRVIKLVIYYFLYNLVFMGVVFGVYGFVNHTSDMPQSGPVYFNLSMWVQLFATLALGIHLLAWKYVTRKDLSFDFPNTAKVLLASVVLSVGMGLWTNYLTELTELPNVMEDLFNKMMYNPLGVISIVVMAPIVEELLFRGGMQGHLLRKWKNPAWAILVSALIFGIVHGNPVQMFFASILGLVLGWVYYRTGSLLPCMLMHFINNGTSVLLFHLSRGEDETMTEALGTTGAICLALVGVALTVWSIWYIKNRLIPNQIAWKETPAPAEEVIASENKEQA